MAPEPRPDSIAPSPPSPPVDAGLETRDYGSTAERQLVDLILRRDRKATARFVANYTDAVYAYVRHRLAPRADVVEDVVQEVFLSALGSLAHWSGASPLRAWLLGIARHKIEDHYRQQLRAPSSLNDDSEEVEPPAEGPLIDEVLDRERLEAKTHRVLRELPESYSMALLWRYWENRSVREMAEATGKTEKAIERLLARARARFKELWGRV
jgi:RNA polymerase sigma-70 factor (ECF subfamily)